MKIGTTKIIIQTFAESLIIPIASIVHIVAEGSYSRVYCDGGVQYLVCENLGAFETGLSEGGFNRCHDSHIINLVKVIKLLKHGGLMAKLTSGEQIPISRRMSKAFQCAISAAT